MQSNAILHSLVNAGAKLDSRNRRGETPLLVAARCCRKTAFEMLVCAGANTKARDIFGHDAKRIVEDGLSDIPSNTESYASLKHCLEVSHGRNNVYIRDVDFETETATATTEWRLERYKLSPPGPQDLHQELLTGQHETIEAENKLSKTEESDAQAGSSSLAPFTSQHESRGDLLHEMVHG